MNIVLEKNGSIPQKAHADDAGLDLMSAESLVLDVGKCRLVSLGFRMNIPKGYEGQIRSRSGMAAKNQVVVLNSPGTVDSGFTGVWHVILANLGSEPYTIEVGQRIAQLVLSKVETLKIEEVKSLEETDRNSNGFGSTDAKKVG